MMDIETKRLIRLLELKDNDILALEQENKALKEKLETFEKNAQEYFFQMSLPEEGENE